MINKLYSNLKVQQSVIALLLFIGLVFSLTNRANAQVNVAPLATASAAPACNTGPCSTLNDLNFGTCGTQQMWITSSSTNPGSAVNVTFTWATPQVINKMTIHAAQNNTRFLGGGTIQIYNGTTWVNHTTFTQALGVCSYDIPFNTVATTAVRIVDIVVTGSQTSNVNFREIEIWQGSLSNNDIGVQSIDSINTVCSTALIPVYATIKNYGKNQITSANVYWSVNGALQTPYSFTGTLDTNGGAGSSTASVYVGDYAFSPSPSVVKIWTGQPNGTADTIKVNDTAMVNKRQSLPAGNYTIGGVGANYSTFTAAIADLYARGICGPVVFNVANGTYNEQIRFAGTVIGSDSINTITFKGQSRAGTILNFASLSSSDRHTVLFTGSAKNIIMRDMTIQGNGNFSGDYAYPVIMENGTRNVSLINSNIQIVGAYSFTATTNYIAIVLGGTSGSYSTSGRVDKITIDSCLISRGYFGVVNYGISGNASADLKFRYNTFQDNYYYGLFFSVGGNMDILYNRFSLFAGNVSHYPVYLSSVTPVSGKNVNIVGNDITTLGTYGIYLSGSSNQAGNKGLIMNNVIGGNTLQQSSYGIYMSSSNYWMIYHNSINMNYVGSTSTNYAGIYMTSTSGNSMINNNIARTATGLGYPVYLSASSNVDTMNFNNFYKADTSNGLIYIAGSYFPATFRGALGFNSNSLNNLPGFVSATNLNITNGCNNGTPLALAPTDINGLARSATAPDMGAYELPDLGNNIGIERIYTPGSTISVGYSDVWALVKNNGNNTVSSFNVGYSNNDSTPVVQYISGTLASCDTMSVYFTGSNQVNLANYNKLKVFTATPNGSIDSFPANDTLVGYYYTPLNGTYTIGGASANFPTFAHATTALKMAGVSGPVTFMVNPGTYNESVTVDGTITGLNASTPIVFDGTNRNLVSIVANKGSAPVFFINQQNYIAVRNMTIVNQSPSGTGVGIMATSANNAGTGCSVVNCKIDMPNYTTGTAYPICVTASSNAYGVSSMRADSITIDSNIINGGYYGITVYGSSSASYNRYIRVRNNTLTNIYYMGAYVAYNYNAIEFIGNSFSMNTAYGYYGVYFYSNQNASTTIGHKVWNNSVVNHGGYGMYIYYPTTNSASSAITDVFNNMVVSGPSYNAVYGINVTDQSSSRSRILNNTAVNRYPTTTVSYAPLYTSGSVSVIAKNNICVNLSGASIPAYFATNPTTGNVNYNLYYNTAGTSLVYRNGTTYTAANYKTAAAGGDSSYNLDPQFVSTTNLHTTNACLPRGVNLGLVTTDIDNETRSSSPMIGADEIVGLTDNMEIVRISSPVAPVTLGAQDVRIFVRNAGSNIVYSFNASYRLNSGTVVTVPFSGLLNPCDTATIVFTGVNQITIPSGQNQIKAFTWLPNGNPDNNTLNDTITSSIGSPLAGNYIVGPAPSDYADLTSALSDANSRGLAGAVNFRIKTGIYDGTYTLTTFAGMSSVNTLTISSLAGHRDSVTLRYYVNTGTPTQVFEIAGSYFKFKDVTIRQTNGNIASNVIKYTNTANFDSVLNCVIWGPMYGIDGTSTSTYTIYNNGISTNTQVYKDSYIKGSFYGFYFYGNSSTYNIKNTQFINNLFDSSTYSNAYYLYYTTGSRFINNTFINRIVSSSYTTGYMYWYYADSGYQCINNNFINGAKAMYWYNYYSRNASSNPGIVANNMLNASAGTQYYYTGSSVTNNWYMYNNTFNTGGGYVYLGNSGITNMRYFNNIFTSTGTYSFYWSAVPSSTSAVQTGYNFYKSTGSTPIYSGSAGLSLTSFKTTYPSWDIRSVSYRAPFTGATSITLNPNDSAIWLINGRGVHLPEITNDFNGVSRPATASAGVPDIGAVEVTPATGVLAPLATVTPATAVAGSPQYYILAEDTVARINWDVSSLVPSANALRFYTGEKPNVQGANGKAAFAHYDFDLQSSSTGFLYDMNLYYGVPLLSNITSLASMKGAFLASGAWNSITPVGSVDLTRRIVNSPAMTNVGPAIWTLTDSVDALSTFLTVNLQPQSQTKCSSDSVEFTVNATGSLVTYQWQVNSGSGFTNITGATGTSLVVRNLNSTYNGYQYRCAISSSLGNSNSDVAILTIGANTAITTQPVNNGGCLGDNVTFTTGASGSNLTYQWEESTGGSFSAISGATSGSLILSNISTSISGYRYRCIVSGTCGVRTSDTATITVSGPISVSIPPAPATINTCAGSTVNATMTATGATTYQWQINTGSGYTNIPGATSMNLSIASVPASYNGGTIRCALSNPCYITFSGTIAISVQTPGLWSGATSTSWTTASNWGCSAVPTAATNVVIPASAVNMPTVSAAQSVNGLTVESGAVVSLSGTGAALNINGDLTANGTFTGSGWLAFVGSASQNISGTSFTKLRVNGTGGVKLASSVTVTDTLALTSGMVTLDNNNLTLGNTAQISGAGSSSYIVTSGTGNVTINNIGTGGRTSAVVFPVGTSSNYNPIAITNAGTADNYSARVIQGAYPNYTGTTPSGAALTSNVVNSTWFVSEAVSGGSNATINVQWNSTQELSGFTRASSYVSRYTTSWFAGAAGAALGANPYTRSISGITAMGPFGVGSNGALPVEWLSFSARANGNEGNLIWSTASEINNDHFVVERSLNNIDFSPVGVVTGNGTTHKVSNYRFTDPTARRFAGAGLTVYYRLVQVDKDGAESLSKVAVLNFNERSGAVSVAPNPFTESFSVSFDDDAIHQVEVMDITGKVLLRTQSAGKGESLTVGQLTEYAAGVYFVRIDGQSSVKLIKN